jgi:O-methyltransferase involved in polyketide biosynthesis
MTDLIPVHLSGPAKTMLTTLYLKALDADLARPVLGDRYAKQVVARLDFDWRQLGITGRWAPLITVRSAQFDLWTRQFLAVHDGATVVHLGCGLDSRFFRVAPHAGVQWFDVDFPAVIELRKQIYPSCPGCHLTAASASDPAWLQLIPVDRPVLLLAEGISMYLTAEEGFTLLRRVVDRFPCGELQIDFYNQAAVRSQKAQRLVRRSGSTLYWAVGAPEAILEAVPAARLLAALTLVDAAPFARASPLFRLLARAVSTVPPLRSTLQYHRYAFGPATRAVPAQNLTARRGSS